MRKIMETKLKPNQAPPIVPHVLVVGDRLHPYKLPPVERHEVLYSTATQVKLSGGKSKAQRLVYCIPNNEAWIEFLEWYELLQTALDKLADNLRSLGHYPDKLKTLGDNAPNPLTKTVICAPSPDYNHSPGWNAWDVYPNKRERKTVSKHTPQMLKLIGDRLQEYATQANHFCCPNSIAWHKFGNLQNAALFQSKCLLKFLDSLETYKQALTNGRYKAVASTDCRCKPQALASVKLPPEPIPTIYDFAPGDRVTFRLAWDDGYQQVIGHVSKEDCFTKNAVIVTYMAPENSSLISQTIGIIALTKLPTEPSFNVEEQDLKVPTSTGSLLPKARLRQRQAQDTAVQRPESDDDKISSEINHLKSQGRVAPAGVWVECCKVTNSNFRQAYWRSRDPCFTPIKGNNPEAKCKKQYIGKENSAAHKAAIAQIERRNKIQKLIKQLPKNLRESI
jgi:hypothetical protein